MDQSTREQIERARRMSGDDKMREGLRLFEQGRDYITNSIRESFPEATPDEVDRIRDAILRRAHARGII